MAIWPPTHVRAQVPHNWPGPNDSVANCNSYGETTLLALGKSTWYFLRWSNIIYICKTLNLKLYLNLLKC